MGSEELVTSNLSIVSWGWVRWLKLCRDVMTLYSHTCIYTKYTNLEINIITRLLVRSFVCFIGSLFFFFRAYFFSCSSVEVRSPHMFFGSMNRCKRECSPRTFHRSFLHPYSLKISMQPNGHALVCEVDTCLLN